MRTKRSPRQRRKAQPELSLGSPHAKKTARGGARTCAGPHALGAGGSDSSELSDGPSAKMDGSRPRVRVKNLATSLDEESDAENEKHNEKKKASARFVASERQLQFNLVTSCGKSGAGDSSDDNAEMAEPEEEEEEEEEEKAGFNGDSEESDDPVVGEANSDEEEKESVEQPETAAAGDNEEEAKSDDSGLVGEEVVERGQEEEEAKSDGSLSVEEAVERENAVEGADVTTPPPIATEEAAAPEEAATEDAAAEVLSPVQDEKKVTPRKKSASKKRRSLDTGFSSSRTRLFKTHEVEKLFTELYQEQEEDDRSMYDITIDTVRDNTSQCQRSEEVDELSLEEYRRLLTYGEVSVESVSKTLLPHLQLRPDDVLYDLGCGTGKVLVQALLETKCAKAVGIELMENRVQAGQRAIERLTHLDIALLGSKTVYIVQGDICKPPEEADITDATVVFINNVMFGPTLMLNLMRKLSSLQNVRRIVTLRKICERHRPEKCVRAGSYCAEFAPPQEFEITVSWTSKASLYVYQRVDNFDWFVDAQNYAYYAQLEEMGISAEQSVRRSSRNTKSPTRISDQKSKPEPKSKRARNPRQAPKPKATSTAKVTRKRKLPAKATAARTPRAKAVKARKR